MSEQETVTGGVVIKDQPVLDLSHLTSPEQLAPISRIKDVALVLVPETLAAAYAAIPVSDVAATIYVPDGAKVRVHTGSLVVGGDGIGTAELIVAGQVTVTGAVSTVGYRHVVIAGQVAAPEASRDALEPVAQIQGQVCWYAGDNPRVFTSDASLGPDFFRLLDHRVSLVVFGNLTIEAGVTEVMLLEKVAGIALFGDITAPAEVVGAVQVLATDVFGAIRASDGPRRVPAGLAAPGQAGGHAGGRAASVDLHRGAEPVDRRWPAPAHRGGHRAGASSRDSLRRGGRRPTAAPASVAVIEAERVAVVSEAISRLPEQQRMALTMAAAGTMTSAEIAAALGVPAGTVRYWLSLARRTLAEALDRYDEQAEES